MRQAYAYDAGICRLNRTGTKVADFRFTDQRGRSRNLYSVQAPYTLLFFSNPGCEACKAIIDDLKASARVSELISSGTLAVVNVYIDQDLDAWRDYAPTYPEEWLTGYDADYTRTSAAPAAPRPRSCILYETSYQTSIPWISRKKFGARPRTEKKS